MIPIAELGRRVKVAAARTALAPSQTKDNALRRAADLLVRDCDQILSVNQVECAAAKADKASPTQLDRLTLTNARIESMARSLRAVGALPDPVGEVADAWERPNGIQIRRVRVPLGVVGVIYENRPNVTSDVAGLCVKAGNAAFLRGSSSAMQTNRMIVSALREGFEDQGLPADAVVLVEDTSRHAAVEFMQLRGIIDCLIPRGGKGLIEAILEHATVPFIIDGDGNCHVYVDEYADLDLAVSIVVNSKTQRPGVCNAAETLLVHEAVAETLLPLLHDSMPQVELRGDLRTVEILPGTTPASDDDYVSEFLDLKLAVRVVPDIEAAIQHVNRFGTGHTEVIVTTNREAADRFAREVDAAVVGVNVSTRFTDGEQFGFGAEVGNSTQKLHCRGPMGLRELTTLKYVLEGTGQIRTS